MVRAECGLSWFDSGASLSQRSFWKAEAVKQAPVSWFRAQAIELGIAEHDNSHHAFAERSFEVIERALVLPDARERDSEIVRRDVLKLGALDQFGKKLQCPSTIASTRSRATQRCGPHGCRLAQRDGVFQRLNGALCLV